MHIQGNCSINLCEGKPPTRVNWPLDADQWAKSGLGLDMQCRRHRTATTCYQIQLRGVGTGYTHALCSPQSNLCLVVVGKSWHTNKVYSYCARLMKKWEWSCRKGRCNARPDSFTYSSGVSIGQNISCEQTNPRHFWPKVSTSFTYFTS